MLKAEEAFRRGSFRQAQGPRGGWRSQGGCYLTFFRWAKRSDHSSGEAHGAAGGHLDEGKHLAALDDEGVIAAAADIEGAPEAHALDGLEAAMGDEDIAEGGGFAVIDLRADDDGVLAAGGHGAEAHADLLGEEGAGDLDDAEVGEVVDDGGAVRVEEHDLGFGLNGRGFHPSFRSINGRGGPRWIAICGSCGGGLRREGGRAIPQGRTSGGVAFLAEDGYGGLRGDEHEADVVVEMGGVRTAGGDFVDIEIEGAVGGDDEAGDAGFLEGLAAGDAEDVLVAIAMAAELEPAVEVAMVMEEDAGAVGLTTRALPVKWAGKESRWKQSGVESSRASMRSRAVISSGRAERSSERSWARRAARDMSVYEARPMASS